MSDLAGIIEQNETFELSNQSINLDISLQGCKFFWENNQCNQDLIDFESGYFINTKKLYKIWFNKDPDIFLSELNKNRLVDLRKDNPKAEISLLYSAERLSNNAKNEMQDFLAVHCIKAVDFDQIYKKAKNDINVSSTELKILSLAKEELDNFAKGNDGGNPAAASDLLRVSKTIIEQLGIYSDFDVHLKFENFSLFQKIESSVVIPTNNNDFLAFAKGANGQEIHQMALEEIYKIQNYILNNYHKYDSQRTDFNLENIEERILFKKAQQANKPFSVVEYRSQIQNFDIYDELELIFLDYNNILNLSSSYADVEPHKLTLSLKEIESVRTLDRASAEKLFCDIQDDFLYLLYKDFAKLNTGAVHAVFESIRNNLNNYEISDYDVKDQILHFENLKSNFSFEILLRKIANLYNKDTVNDIIKSHYCHLATTIYLLGAKSYLYKNSIIYISGPEVVLKMLYEGEERKSFSPETNKITGIIKGKQDGSWYLVANE